jgi:membrane-associated protease RseP (regulator of RpoE activity)
MVLTLNRLAVLAALSLCFARHSDAQRSGFLGRGGMGQSDGPRPLLFGFALECSGCSRGQPEDRVFPPVWHYTAYPRVVAVAPGGAAEQAGIHEGDLLMSIDGISLLSPEGASRFSASKPRDNIRLTVDRGGKTVNVELAPRAARPPFLGRGERFLREPVPREYSGRVGNAAIDVTSDEPVVATTDASGMLTLRIAGTTVRIRPPLPQSPSPPASGPKKP